MELGDFQKRASAHGRASFGGYGWEKLQWAPVGRIKGMLLAQRLSSAPGGRSSNLPLKLLAMRGFQRSDVLLSNRRKKPLLESFKWSLAEVVAFAGWFASHLT